MCKHFADVLDGEVLSANAPSVKSASDRLQPASRYAVHIKGCMAKPCSGLFERQMRVKRSLACNS